MPACPPYSMMRRESRQHGHQPQPPQSRTRPRGLHPNNRSGSGSTMVRCCPSRRCRAQTRNEVPVRRRERRTKLRACGRAAQWCSEQLAPLPPPQDGDRHQGCVAGMKTTAGRRQAACRDASGVSPTTPSPATAVTCPGTNLRAVAVAGVAMSPISGHTSGAPVSVLTGAE